MDGLLKVLLKYPNGTKLNLKWKNGYEIVGIIDTIYETDNGLEISDEGYEEFYACTIKIVEVISRPNEFNSQIAESGLIEISKYNKPHYVMLDNGVTLWEEKS